MLEIINFQISVKCAKSVHIVEAKLLHTPQLIAMVLQILGGELGTTTKMFLAQFRDSMMSWWEKLLKSNIQPSAG